MTRRRLSRLAHIASPFGLLALGTWALLASPWPVIFGLMLRGQHVTPALNGSTVGLGAVAAVCFLAALAVSYTIRREPR